MKLVDTLSTTAQLATEKHLLDTKPGNLGGCTCGFVAWSGKHIVSMIVRDDLMPLIEDEIDISWTNGRSQGFEEAWQEAVDGNSK